MEHLRWIILATALWVVLSPTVHATTMSYSKNYPGFLQITCPGDVNGDGKVDIIDMSLVSAHFGTKIGDANYLPAADLNHDGKIDIVDLSIVSSHFGLTCIY